MTPREYFLQHLSLMETIAHADNTMDAMRIVDQAFGYILGLYAGRSELFTDELAHIWEEWRNHILFGKDYTLPEE